MDKLTEHILQAIKTMNTEWKEIALEESNKDDPCFLWRVRSTNKDQPIKEITVRFDETGPVSAEIVPAIPVIKSADDALTWLFSSVEFWGWEVDDVDVILMPIGRLRTSCKQKHFSKADFLKLWPSLEPQVKAAHEVSLIFREEIFNFLKVQVVNGN